MLALAYGVMASQLYPMLKYALGHGKACTRVAVAGQTLAIIGRSGVGKSVTL